MKANTLDACVAKGRKTQQGKGFRYKLISITVAFMLAFGMLPATGLNAFAEEYDGVPSLNSYPENHNDSVSNQASSDTEDISESEQDSAANDDKDGSISDYSEANKQNLSNGNTESSAVEPSKKSPAPDTSKPADSNQKALAPHAKLSKIVIGNFSKKGTIKYQNPWHLNVKVTLNKGKPSANIIIDGTSAYDSVRSVTVEKSDTITVEEIASGAFRKWGCISAMISSDVLTCSVLSMPPMNAFTTNSSGTEAGDGFFASFNAYGAITSFPAGSFDTSKITKVGLGYFSGFNWGGALTSLPAGSFNTSNIKEVGDAFFMFFNHQGGLKSLPKNSFNISKISNAKNDYFDRFNYRGALTVLPAGSFNTSKISAVGDNFFAGFSTLGNIVTLPKGSFNISKIKKVGDNFFSLFLALDPPGAKKRDPAALPDGSFDASGITEVGNSFFDQFCHDNSNLAYLPDSFALPKTLTTSGNNYCRGMFRNCKKLAPVGQVATKTLFFAKQPEQPFLDTTINLQGTGPSYTAVVASKAAPLKWKRLAGPDRYQTMEKILQTGFSANSTTTVIIATGENFPDALAASGLGGLLGAPVIITPKAKLGSVAAKEIKRLKPTNAIIMGSRAAVSKKVEESLVARGLKVSRVQGKTRVETAVKIYQAGTKTSKWGSNKTWGSTAIVACSQGFPDALSISSFAYAKNAPIFLTDKKGVLTKDALKAIKGGKFTNIIIVGSEVVVAKRVETSQLKGLKVVRLAGDDRYATSLKIAQYGIKHGMRANAMGIATGTNFPDALSGASFCGKRSSVILLTNESAVAKKCAKRFLSDNMLYMKGGYIFGDKVVVSNNLVKYFQKITS